ncbi:MAG: T9SS C-terminal target domain-containing protein, partial [Saprospirales bacterium]
TNTVTLFPNFNTYADNPTDSFWVDQETGLGNKVFEGNTFVEGSDLVGKIVTFEGEVQSYTLSPDYEARVFIRVFNTDFSVLKEVSEELTEEGPFSITFDNPEADDALVQFGFSVTGLNANPEDEEALGNVVIGDEVDPGFDEPMNPAPTPTEDPENVISLFSEAYEDVEVDTWRTDWSAAEFEDIEIQGNPTKFYTMLDFVGIETTGDNLVDATEMEFFHMDIWTPNMDIVRIKLVDFGPDGEFGGDDDSEHEIVFEGLAKGEWHSLQIPLEDFEDLESTANLAQYILSGTPVGEGVLYVDNVYFSKTPVSISEIEDHQIRLFPNPASDMIHIDSEKTINGITIFDYSGKTVLQLENPSNQIDISALPGGMYVVLIEGKDLFTTKKIVIK